MKITRRMLFGLLPTMGLGRLWPKFRAVNNVNYIKGAPFTAQFVDTNSDPIENGTVKFYLWNTLTPTDVYSNSSGTSIGTSVDLDGHGAPINSGAPVDLFFDESVVYKFVLKDAAGTAIAPPIGPYSSGSGSSTRLSIDAIDSDAADCLYDYTAAENGQLASIAGYYTPGDGGGGVFHWNASSADADDGGVTILPTGHAGAGRWTRIYSGDINAKWFGVKMDGTDATTEIQAAIDAQVDGGWVYFPAGVYTVSTLDFGGVNGKGDGFLRSTRGELGASGYPIESNFDGTIIRCTATTGNAISIGKGPANRKGPALHDLIIIGPGTGTSTGVYIDHLLSADWRNVQVANFNIGYDVEWFEDCTLTTLRVSGCNIGFRVSNSGTNQNTFINFEAVNCITTIDGTYMKLCVFYGGVIQGGNLDYGIILREHCDTNQFNGIWFESSTPWGIASFVTEGTDNFSNSLINCRFSQANNAILLGGVTGGFANGGHIIENLFIAGGSVFTLTIEAGLDPCFLRNVDGTVEIIDNSSRSVIERSNGVFSPWVSRGDYDRGESRASSKKAFIQYAGVADSGNQYLRYAEQLTNIGFAESINRTSILWGDGLGNNQFNWNISNGNFIAKGRVSSDYLEIIDGRSAVSASVGKARLYVDTADGKLKIVFGDGTVKTILTDT